MREKKGAVAPAGPPFRRGLLRDPLESPGGEGLKGLLNKTVLLLEFY